MADYDASKWREVFRLSSAKLGVALAVIKSKPVGKSGRQHAEDLAVRFKQQQENWKSKAEDLKEEVLSLKQELLLSKLLRKQQNGAETARGEDIVKLFSQDLPEAQLSENDSGCDTQTLSLTPDPVDAVLSSKVVPPRSLRPSQASFLRDARDRALAKHTRFLHNLCTLRRSEKNTQADGGDAVLEDTALNMIQSLVEAHREAGGGSTGDMSQLDRFVQASQLVVQALEGGGVGRRKVLEKAEELLEELLELLLNNSQLNKFAVQDNLTECLICLGGASALRPVLVHLVLTRIVRLAEQLWGACQEVPEGQQPQQVDWVRYDNSFYLFWILEQLLQARSCSTGSEHHHHLQLSQLEKHILPLSDEFPLFALYMWRIEGLLKPACTRGT
ncbi:meiosis-specific protein MEI4 isoform X1 [Tachysurus fulvidraco]|uniref:meiosis-specific protein MEI4 isoform X1 n=1 Tax=Tachysurus fulvidraco TaxID=1234273 RepID=UPI001FED96A0|nr:meiosis-specific protein MEI4 isoform X1 [Tachysurus fulvidraco]